MMRAKKLQRGIAAVELALIISLLLLLLLAMIDAARALQANTIVNNISREGANLAARGNTPLETGSQQIIGPLMASAPPLNVNQNGMVYITRVMGVGTGTGARSVVVEQYRWTGGAGTYVPVSRVHQCGTWTGAACTSIDSKSRPTTGIMSGKLGDGEIAHVVETFYRFDMLVSGAASALGLAAFGPDLYSITVF